MRKIISFEVPDDTSYMQCTLDYRYDEGREWGSQEKFTKQIVKNNETIVKENIDDFINWVVKKHGAMPILYNESTGWVKLSDMSDEYIKEIAIVYKDTNSLQEIISTLEECGALAEHDKQIRNEVTEEFLNKAKEKKYHSNITMENAVAIAELDWIAGQLKGE